MVHEFICASCGHAEYADRYLLTRRGALGRLSKPPKIS